MATRRMRIKAVINVNRGGPKVEASQEASITPSVIPSSDNAPSVPSPRICSGPVSPAPSLIASNLDSGGDAPPPSPGAPARVSTPPVSIPPTSPHSPSAFASSWQLQRPSPSRSPAGLPPSGSILRRSPSPALSRLTNSPGPPLSPVKSPVPSYSYASPLSPVKHVSRNLHGGTPSTSVSSWGVGKTDLSYPTTSSPGLSSMEMNIKSPPSSYVFRPPPSPSHSAHQDFPSLKSPPSSVARPSPSQSPVLSSVRSASTSSASLSFLSHHFNSNSNSADSHEVAALMSANTNNVSSYPSPPSVTGFFPQSPEKRISGRDSVMSGGSENTFPSGHFSNVSNSYSSPSPSFSKSVFGDPETLKRRAEENRKKEAAQASATRFAAARKEFYDKVQAGQQPERNKLTMLHFTFYNPPDPNKPKPADRKSRSRASSVCSDISTISKQEQDLLPPPILNNENLGKASSAPSSIAGSRRTTASSIGSGGSIPASEGGQSETGSVASNASSNGSVPGPRVKVGPDGQLIIDEKSLVMETSESQRARQQIEDMEVVSGAEYAVGSSGFYRYKKSYRRGTDWTERETIRFYRALNQCGTDFSMMQKLFPYRSRQELKSKFKREDRKNPDLISKVLQSCVFDPDEGISSEEESEIDPTTGKKKLAEAEEIICSSQEVATVGPPGAKKMKIKKEKKKEMEFSKEQLQEMKANLNKGPGTGKGKKWNTPVEGLVVGGKLPPPPTPVIIKVESLGSTNTNDEGSVAAPTKPKKKYVRKKKQVVEGGNEVQSNAGATPTSISQPTRPTPPPGTVSIIMATGVFSGSGVGVDMASVKKEKPDVPISKNIQAPKVSQSDSDGTASKRRSRVPKKPNVKGGGRSNNKAEAGLGEKIVNEPSQPSPTKGLCDELFRFDANDPAGLKVVPSPLIAVEETLIEGNEDGAEDLVIVDLDELKSLQTEAQQQSSSSVPGTSTGKVKRKKKDTGRVVLANTCKDPYGIAVVSPGTSQGKRGFEAGASSSVSSDPPAKKLKTPYRVPGPGGVQPATSQSLSSSELVVEINLSES